MRGGAQSHLLEADDGHFYVVKFLNNPQHRRILINELIASCFLRYLQIAAPQTAIISVSEEFVAENPALCLQLGQQRTPVQAGWHFGSCFPGDPARLAVYDFLPDTLLKQVSNLGALPGRAGAGQVDVQCRRQAGNLLPGSAGRVGASFRRPPAENRLPGCI